jgi:hypothetical protein
MLDSDKMVPVGFEKVWWGVDLVGNTVGVLGQACQGYRYHGYGSGERKCVSNYSTPKFLCLQTNMVGVHVVACYGRGFCAHEYLTLKFAATGTTVSSCNGCGWCGHRRCVIYWLALVTLEKELKTKPKVQSRRPKKNEDAKSGTEGDGARKDVPLLVVHCVVSSSFSHCQLPHPSFSHHEMFALVLIPLYTEIEKLSFIVATAL